MGEGEGQNRWKEKEMNKREIYIGARGERRGRLKGGFLERGGPK